MSSQFYQARRIAPIDNSKDKGTVPIVPLLVVTPSSPSRSRDGELLLWCNFVAPLLCRIRMLVARRGKVPLLPFLTLGSFVLTIEGASVVTKKRSSAGTVASWKGSSIDPCRGSLSSCFLNNQWEDETSPLWFANIHFGLLIVYGKILWKDRQLRGDVTFNCCFACEKCYIPRFHCSHRNITLPGLNLSSQKQTG